MNFLDQLRAQLNERIAERNALKAEMDDILATPAAEGRTALTDAETAAFDEKRSAIVSADEDIEAKRSRVAELEAIEARQHEAAKAPGVNVRVKAEEATYHQGNASARSFFADAYNARRGDTDAAERINRNAAEARANGLELRDVGTSAFGALVVPQYLVDLYAPTATAGRPFANAVRSLPLPAAGMTLNIPRITTATGVALQSSENSAVQETNMDETTYSVSVRTFAGQQDVSRQALERGEMIDAIVFGDLLAQYATTLDSHIINHGTDGVLSISSVDTTAYTDASPTVAEFMPKLFDSIQQVTSTRYLPPTLIVMHPRRWGWLCAAVDSTNRPLIVPNTAGPFNAQGVGRAAEYGQIVGQLAGLPVLVDANVPTNVGAGTNEDVVIVCRADDLLLMEQSGAPRQLRFEETTGGSLTTKLVVYGYAAFASSRYPTAVSLVSGTGLVTPSF